MAKPQSISGGTACRNCAGQARSLGLCRRCYDRVMYLRRRSLLLADPSTYETALAKQRVRQARWKAKQTYHDRFTRHILTRYGLTLERYMDMYQRQSGSCGICRTPYPPIIRAKERRLYVDHDHKTGCPRGLLCHSCNTAIGHLRDDAELLERAIAYLGGGRVG